MPPGGRPHWPRRCCTARPRARPGPRCPRSCSGWQARSRLSRPRPGCSRCPRVPTSPGVWWQAAARGNAIHGLNRWAAWTAVQQDASALRLRSAPHGQQGYPFGLEIEAEYRLDAGTGLQVTVAARNRGSRAAPYGTGSHPSLTVRTSSVDGCELTLPADSWLPLDDRGLPSGPPEPVDGTAFDFRQPRVIGTTRLDHALTGLSCDDDGRAWAYLAAPGGPRAGLWAGEGYRWLQVFTGDPLGPDMRRRAVAIEPMTCPPNAFVTADDLLVLEPGEKVTHTWGVQAC